MRELLNLLRICIPHIWGPWHRYGSEQETRTCSNCNERQTRNRKN